MSRSARSPNSLVSDQWAAPTTSAVFTAIRRMARDDGLGAEPKLQRRQELSNRSRSHNEKSPKIGPNLTRFAYDRINGHNPWQRLRKFEWNLCAHDRPSSGTATTSAFPTIPRCHAAAKSHASVAFIYVLDDKSAGHSAARRRGAMVAGAVAARPAGEPAQAGCIAGVAQGICACGHRRARPRDRCRSGLLERDRAGAAPGRGRSGCRRAG